LSSAVRVSSCTKNSKDGFCWGFIPVRWYFLFWHHYVHHTVMNL